jgi:DNA-binding IclR family transcriptional regulator
MAQIDQLIAYILNKDWLSLTEIANALNIDYVSLIKIVHLLEEFRFVEVNDQRIRVRPDVKRLLESVRNTKEI